MTLKFSDNPGYREMHLKRKLGNPLFGPSSHVITQADINKAAEEDSREREQLEVQLHKLVTEAMELKPNEQTEKVLDLKERIDRLYIDFSAFGAEFSSFKDHLMKLHAVLMSAIKGAAGADTVAISELEREAEAHQMHVELMNSPLAAQLLKDACPIEKDELVPTLLSVSPADVIVTMQMFDAGETRQLYEQADHLVSSLDPADITQDMRDAVTLIKSCMNA